MAQSFAPGVYTFGNIHGFFGIIWRGVERPWHVMWEDEGLGSYPTPQMALDDLVGGHCYSPSTGFDTSQAGLPDDLSDWAWKAARRAS
jgi:hypothetical protein